MTRHLLLALFAATLVMVAVPARAADKKPQPLEIRMSASFAPVESDVIVRMRVEPNPRSRVLTLEWVSDDLSGGSHAITLDGERAATTHQYSLKRMSPGTYEVTAILRLSDGSEMRRSATVTVVGVSYADGGGIGGAQGSAGGGRSKGR